MITIQMLEDNDVIEENDCVRQLSLRYTGQSDYLETVSTYGGGAVNRLGWIRAKYFCPAWVGKTVGEFRKALLIDRIGKRHAVELSDYEFVRGAVPMSHMERLTNEQIRIADSIWKSLNSKRDEELDDD